MNQTHLSKNDTARLYKMAETLKSLLMNGQQKEALTIAQTMTESFPHYSLGWQILGSTLMQSGRIADALKPLLKSAELLPDDAAAQEALGRCLYHLGKQDLAEACFRQATKIKPDYAEAHNSLGIVLRNLNRIDDAVASHRRALEIKPDYADAHVNLGVIQKDLGQLDAAVASYRRAIEIRQDYAEAHSNLGIVLKDMGHPEEAIASYRRAIEIKPDFAFAYSNLGNALEDLRRTEEAIASYRRVLEIEPDYTAAKANLGFSLLMAGLYSEGWQKYEYRWEFVADKLHPATHLPQWTGQIPGPGDRLLIFCEQGFGDKIQFARYIPLAQGRFGGRVSVIVDSPLLSLFRRSFPGVEILETAPDDQSAWQWHCPLLSLPLAFGTVLENIPGQSPYLVADPSRIAAWKSRIDELNLQTGTRKIGVVWKPGAGMKIAKLKALDFAQLLPLMEPSPGIAWFSLQKEPDPDSSRWSAQGKLIDWTGAFKDFDDTAALIMNLDMIISVDTSVVHLAGALGRPAWLFNRYASEWRWMRGKEYSPWYPSIRIFTQETTGDWDSVVKRMIAALSGALHSER